MTTLLGIQYKNSVLLGADSQITEDNFKTLSTATPKIIRRGRYLIGITGDTRPGDILTYNWKPSNEIPEDIIGYSEENTQDTKATMYGFVAQEVKATMEELGYDIEAYYLEEGVAFTGKYADGSDEYYEYGNMSADEMEESLPEWAEDQFNLISRKRDDEEWEDSEDEEESVYEPGQYTEDEKTDWLSAKSKPVYEGLYEVKTKEWPFPHTMEWTKNGWSLRDLYMPPTTKVTDWRGLNEDPTEKQAELTKALEELKAEFDALIATEQDPEYQYLKEDLDTLSRRIGDYAARQEAEGYKDE